MSKKLIQHASTSVPKEEGKQLHPESYSEKKTRSGSAEDTSGKPSDKSRQSNT
jgi:hypothetical protein